MITKEDIAKAYFFMLGREPESSLNIDDVMKNFATPDILRDAIMFSPESIQRNYAPVAQSIGNLWFRHPTYFGRQIYLCISDTAISRTIMQFGSWEPEVGKILLQEMTPNSTVLDIGANLGWFSLMLGDYIQRNAGNGRVYSFEANPNIIPYLNASIMDSGLMRQVSIKPYAVSERPTRFQMTNSTFGNIGGLQVGEVATSDQAQNRNVVPALPLDDLMIDLNRCDLIKMDIEGAEMMAINGYIEGLKRFKPKILMEINPRALELVSNVTVDDLFEKMTSLGYSCFDVIGREKRNKIGLQQLKTIVSEKGYYDFFFVPNT